MSWDRFEQISRRRFLHDALIVATATQFFPGLERTLLAEGIPDVAHIRGDGSSAKVTTLALRRNLSVLSGVGGNVIVLPGSDGKVLVEAGYATSQRQIAAALNAISSDPPRHLIDIHWHFDHTDAAMAGSMPAAPLSSRTRIPENASQHGKRYPHSTESFRPRRPGLFLRLFSPTNEALASMAKRFFSNTIPPLTRIATSR
jgi:hypothetical protein